MGNERVCTTDVEGASEDSTECLGSPIIALLLQEEKSID
jgi:hypothetical protein